jgi:hypothetical protein
LSSAPEGNLLYSKPSLAAAISDKGGIDKVLQFIIDSDIDTDQTHIYCDYADYLCLACTWFKTIIPGFTQQAFTDIVIRDIASRKYIDRYFTNDSKKSFTITDRDKAKIAIDLSTSVSLSNQLQNIANIWSTTSAVTGLTYDTSKLSIEFQMASYLSNGWSGASTYQNIVVDFILNVVVGDIVEEFKSSLLHNLFVLNTLDEFKGFDPLNDDLKTWMGPTHPFAFIADPNFRVNNLAYVKANYNLAQIGNLYNKYTHQPFHLDMALYLGGANYNTVMAHEFNELFGLRYFGVEQDTLKTSNMYLIYFIYNLSKNNPLRLKEFAV